MEKRKRSRTTRKTQLEDVPELIHLIQSMLPEKEAARTCILSKSWLQAWSTIPTLRFPCETKYNNLIDRTLVRYHLDKIPIESFDIEFEIIDQNSASLAEKWIRLVASKSCLKDLSLRICVAGIDSFTLPHDILFSSQNLNSINLRAFDLKMTRSLFIPTNVMIKCVSLRSLVLEDVDMSDDILDKLLSTCCLLEKIKLSSCNGLKTVKVKNLPFLRELQLLLIEQNDLLEIHNVPNLCSFHYSSIFDKPLPFNPNSLGSLTHLHIHGVIIDNEFLDIIKSKFPSLHSLTLVIDSFSWGLQQESNLVITSLSLTTLTLKLWLKNPKDVQVYAPNLISFLYHGISTPTILFPTVAPKHTNLDMKNIDHPT